MGIARILELLCEASELMQAEDFTLEVAHLSNVISLVAERTGLDALTEDPCDLVPMLVPTEFS